MIHLTVFKASFRKIAVWIWFSNFFIVGMWEILIAVSSGLPWWLSSKESTCNAGDAGDLGVIPWVVKIPWRRKWQPTSVFLPGKSHGERSQVDHSPWGHKESDTTEWLSTHTHTHFCVWLVWLIAPPPPLSECLILSSQATPIRIGLLMWTPSQLTKMSTANVNSFTIN